MFNSKKKAVTACCCQTLCCDNRCVPLVVALVDGQLQEIENPGCQNRLPEALTVNITGTPDVGTDTCFDGTGTISYKTALSGGVECWDGILEGSCTDCLGATLNWKFKITLCCKNRNNEYTISLTPIETICPAVSLSTDASASICEPLLVEGCFPVFGACTPACFDDMFMPIASRLYTVCVEIFET